MGVFPQLLSISSSSLLIFIIKFLLILCEFHIVRLIPTHLSAPPYLPSSLAASPSKENKIYKFKETKIQKFHLSVEAVICHSVSHSVSHPFVHTALLANVHCNESLAWFEAFGFCYINSVGFSPDSSQISCCPVS